MKLNQRTVDQIHSPIGEAFALVEKRGGRLPLINVSQAAPSHPCPPQVADHLARAVYEPDAGFYCPQEGLVHLREAFAADLTTSGVGAVEPDQILITAGCNQAFALTVSALCSEGDEVIIVEPFYFNHDMWLRLQGFVPIYAPNATAEAIAPFITGRTRAVVVVSPGNPTGETIAAAELSAIYALCDFHDLTFILDETYRSFRGVDDAPHTLHKREGWGDRLVSLHSFSKEFAIPGYRVGAAVAGLPLLAEVMKLLDCVTICAPRIGQEAAWAGLTMATEWRSEQARRVRSRQAAFEAVMAGSPGGFTLETAGAYFGWVRAPDNSGPTAVVVERLIVDHDVLTIPGTAFTREDRDMIRMSFANLDEAQIDDLGARLATFSP
ncbi:MAG: aminotransferase [Actinomycetia bacterium]|nr:aminotransferase [Actinomycetes bacterium]MCP4961449.1 aminotransferase [Actinomycetes bacterium]